MRTESKGKIWMSFVYVLSQTVQTTTVLLSHMTPKSHLLFAKSVSIELAHPFLLPSQAYNLFLLFVFEFSARLFARIEKCALKTGWWKPKYCYSICAAVSVCA